MLDSIKSVARLTAKVGISAYKGTDGLVQGIKDTTEELAPQSVKDFNKRTIKEQGKIAEDFGYGLGDTIVRGTVNGYNHVLGDTKPVVKKSTGYGFVGNNK